MFNTAMIFELAVIKQQAVPLLEQVPENCDEYSEAYRLLKFLKIHQAYHKPPGTAHFAAQGVPRRKLFQILMRGNPS